MKLSKQTKQMAKDLGLSEADAVVMQMKSQLYELASEAISQSDLTHEVIAKKVGTSRARISRVANLGENSVSIELLVKIIVAVEQKLPFKFTAA